MIDDPPKRFGTPRATEVIQIRCTTGEKDAWLRAAAEKKLPLTTYMKYVLNNQRSTKDE